MTQLGDTAPDFTLSDTDGDEHSLVEGFDATVVAFTCNHCPYALAWHDRLLDVARDYADRGVRVLLVNPNDAERYPRDSFDAMKERVAADGGWPAPYLHDESQEVARALRRQDHPRRVRGGRGGAAPLPRSPRLRPWRSLAGRLVAARGARRRARRPRARPAGDGAGRVQRQVEGVSCSP